MSERPLGISGRIAGRFLDSELTPLLALAGLLLGVAAVLITPREEEPQINVTVADVFVPYPGASAAEVEQTVTIPAEQVLSEIEGIKHVYSVSRPGMALVTVRYRVGEDRTEAIVRLYNKVYSNQDWLPPGLGVGQPLIKPRGIDDVPVVTITLWTADPQRGAHELKQVAHALETDLKRLPDTRGIYTLGGPDRVVRVRLDPQRLAGHGIALDDLRNALQAANASSDTTSIVQDGHEVPVKAGLLLRDAEEVGALVVAMRDGRPVFLSDVADIREGPDDPESYVRHVQAGGSEVVLHHPAVTVAVEKKPGTNAVDLARAVTARVEAARGALIPEGIETTITRDYGRTADDKASKLIQKLMFATASVVILVWLAMGWREAIIVGVAVVVTLAATLFASWAWGFTLNRVSLFALIFSIGILVDDAIVVVENVHRHLQIGGRRLREAIARAVDEVGGPTILATLTVIAALLPMAFVTGLMGPYMSPIPINASMGMLISLAVALVVSPWLCLRLLGRHSHGGREAGGHAHGAGGGRLQSLFDHAVGPFLRGPRARLRRWLMLGFVLVLIALSVSLVATRIVVLKMLPFDNKSEFEVVVDMPEGTALESTARVLDAIGDTLAGVAEVAHFQTYAGTHAPIGFNGLVRQYYLRNAPHTGQVQVNLVDKHHRDRQSHDIARDVRERLQPVAREFDAALKVVEVPPGPPVLSPLVAEVYGPDYDGQLEVAGTVRGLFESTRSVVDIDDTVQAPAPRLVLVVDRSRAAYLGVSQRAVSAAVAAVLGGEDAGYLHGDNLKYAVPIRIEFDPADKADIDTLLALEVRSGGGGLVPLSEIVTVEQTPREQAIHHKDLLPVVYVTGDAAGSLDSPLYGMFEMFFRLQDMVVMNDRPLSQHLVAQPDDPWRYAVKWDGEWQVTYETFRDMGIAYAVGIVLIYLLTVAQFRSYLVPLIIMAPIPLTVIGVLPGHALLGAKFTATSMIGMIALAGIIVRNSILLVDFVDEEVRGGVPLDQAIVRSGAVRARPIVLTALAAMLGAFFILDDPIFNGLAVSLIFGILVSTLLTLVVIPVLYYALRRRTAA